MNTRFIASNLREAEEELRQLCDRAEAGEELPFEKFHVAMAHIYHHLNSAWNGRYAADEQWRECSDQHFAAWEKFPQDLPLIGDDGFMRCLNTRRRRKQAMQLTASKPAAGDVRAKPFALRRGLR